MSELVSNRRIRLPSVSRSLQVLAVFVLVLILGATAQQLLSVRSAIIENTKRQMSRLDMVFAEQTGRAVETVDFILRNAMETLQALKATPPVDARAFDELLRRPSKACDKFPRSPLPIRTAVSFIHQPRESRVSCRRRRAPWSRRRRALPKRAYRSANRFADRMANGQR
jgi:hypothetical protein